MNTPIELISFNVRHLAALNRLKKGEPVNLTTLSEVLHCSPATITGVRDRLQKSGYIEDHADTDRRACYVKITESGKKALQELTDILSK